MLEKLSQPASSVDLTLGKIKCTCCHCGARFTPLEIEGEYLDRRCPSCSGQLNEAEYDNAYLELAKKMPELQGKLDTITSEIQACKDEDLRLKKIHHHEDRKPIRNRLGELSFDELQILGEIEQVTNEEAALGRSRYYTGEWFLRTHTHREPSLGSPYSIDIGYGDNGA